MRLAYFGLPLAGWLLARDGHDVRLAVLPPARGPGKRRLLRALGRERVLDALELGEELERRVDAALEREAPELVVSWFWTRRLPERWLERARLGGIGAHPSLLPRHRGPDPYFRAIDAGDDETGVTVHRLTERYDEGDVLATRRLAIGERDAWQLARALDRPSLALLRECVTRLARGGELRSVPQDEARATWAPAPSGDELRADFRWPTSRVLRRIRALGPAPGLPLEVEGLPLVVTRAGPASEFPRALEPGETAVIGEPPSLVLRTAEGAVVVERAIFELDGGTERSLGREEVARLVQNHLAEVRARLR